MPWNAARRKSSAGWVSRTADEFRAEYDFSGGVRGKHHAAHKAGTV